MEDKTAINLESVMKQLEALGRAQIKKIYINHGAKEPLFGVTTGAMKPLARKIKKNYPLSMQLYATGNYDAMYFAGMISDPQAMTKADLEDWMEAAYCQGLADYVVAVTLAESKFSQELADRWIRHDNERYQSAGFTCYAWLLGVRPDSFFEQDKLRELLHYVEQNIHVSPNRVRYSMNGFLIALGISYLPLHEEALLAAKAVGEVQVDFGQTSCKTPIAYEAIGKAVSAGRIGGKRRSGRC